MEFVLSLLFSTIACQRSLKNPVLISYHVVYREFLRFSVNLDVMHEYNKIALSASLIRYMIFLMVNHLLLCTSLPSLTKAHFLSRLELRSLRPSLESLA